MALIGRWSGCWPGSGFRLAISWTWGPADCWLKYQAGHRRATGSRIAQHAPRIAAIVLAAGKSSRMGSNKLLADLNGKPLLRHSVEALKASSVHDIIVVTGNEPERVQIRP